MWSASENDLVKRVDGSRKLPPVTKKEVHAPRERPFLLAVKAAKLVEIL
jgi:hypothetical protein